MKKIFTHVQTKKEWWIEVDDNCFRTCLNNGKVKETICTSDYDLQNQSIRAIMAKMRKGFVYSNPNAGFAKAIAHVFISTAYTGFMPIAARTDKDDFYICRTIGQFEDEVLYYFGKNGKLLSQTSLGAGRLTLQQVWNLNDTLYLNNNHQIECFTPETGTLDKITEYSKGCFISMLDAKGVYTLYYNYNKKEIVVYELTKNQCVWSKVIDYQGISEPDSNNYKVTRLSETGNMVLYKPETGTYVLVDLDSKKEIIIKNDAEYCFFSPDDQYFNIGETTYETKTGNIVINNPFPFDVANGKVEVTTRGSIMAIRYVGFRAPIQLWDYNTSQLLATVDDPFIVRRAEFAFTKGAFILHTDYGVLSIYNCEL